MIFIDNTDCGARFSQCRQYRYTLWRRWEPDCPLSNMVAFIGLNPSTADEIKNDPTVKRCINFAIRWGYGGMVMLNLFAYRATDPKVMKAHAEPIGPSNDDAIRDIVREIGETIFAWGNHGLYMDRGKHVFDMVCALDCVRHRGVYSSHLGLTSSLQPKHPLYLKADLDREPITVGFEGH